MNKIKFTLLSICVALSLSGCNDSYDVSDKFDGVLAFSKEGFSTLEFNGTGSETTVDLWIQQGGLNYSPSTISISVDPLLLDSLNKAEFTSYQMLPADCYKFANTTLSTSSATESLLKQSFTYNPTKIKELSGYDKVKYVLPLRATSVGMPFLPDRSIMLIGFKVTKND